ncbi:MAG TPA: hypothetical protein PKL85_05955, partial [Bacteroidia bacterium]|nr:hypothetical protein [Bacteroidia bacterium]
MKSQYAPLGKTCTFCFTSISVVFLLLCNSAWSDPNAFTNMTHNFTSDSWNTYNYTTTLGQQLCQPCHTPHNSLPSDVAPLWNHQLSSATYSIYESVKDGSSMGVNTIDGTSKLFLSCHDGTVALGSFGGQIGSQFITGGFNFTTDLKNDHPVSIDYSNALSGGYGELHQTTHVFANYDTLALTYVPASEPVTRLLDVNG